MASEDEARAVLRECIEMRKANPPAPHDEYARPPLQRICITCGRTYCPDDDALTCRACALAERASHVPPTQQTLGGEA